MYNSSNKNPKLQCSLSVWKSIFIIIKGPLLHFDYVSWLLLAGAAKPSKANEHQPVEAGKIYHVYPNSPDVWHISFHWLTISYIDGEMKINSPHMEHIGSDLWVNHACSRVLEEQMNPSDEVIFRY